ncbi:outer membrane protein assembly factor BamD [Candidatus Babeliales bacterium]|nr:outer membrane protein assembly factor BamD [Candidatus Babeliales bacterium]
MFKRFSSLVLLSGIFILSGCSKEKEKNIADMSFNELKSATTTFIESGDKNHAIVALEGILEKYSEKKEISDYRLILADLHFIKRNYAAADRCYEKYAQMNPGNSEYAAYKSILSKFKQTLDKYRDPSMAKKTLGLAKAFINTPDFDSGKYTKEVKNIIYTCEKKLIDNEIQVLNFYIRQGKFSSAEKRIEYLKEHFISKHAEVEPQIVYLESKLAYRKKDKKAAQEKYEVLADKFPDSEFTTIAQRMLNKKNDFLLF